MVSACAGNKKVFGLDRGSNNYSDLAHAEVVMICGTNVSETFPTLTHWRGTRATKARSSSSSIPA
jgi:assimilatory nitrate reductase catalytic subunit